MSLCFSVLQVQRASKGLERVVVGLLEFNMLRGELRGALLDQLLQLPDAAVFFIFRRNSIHTWFPTHVGICNYGTDSLGSWALCW